MAVLRESSRRCRSRGTRWKSNRLCESWAEPAAAGMPPAICEGMPTTEKKLEELDALIDGIETAMFTTRRADGHLVSRPMATQKRIAGADLWFVTNTDTHKLDEIKLDPNVNCSYYNSRTREWVSVSGVAHVSRDRHKIR